MDEINTEFFLDNNTKSLLEEINTLKNNNELEEFVKNLKPADGRKMTAILFSEYFNFRNEVKDLLSISRDKRNKELAVIKLIDELEGN